MMTTLRPFVLAFSSIMLVTSGLWAATEVEAAEAVARAFLVALYQNDKAAAAAHVVSEEGLEGFVGTQALDDSTKAAVQADIAALEIELAPGYEDLRDGRAEPLPDGAPIRFSLAYRGVPMAVTTIKGGDEWKVDLRWWTAMRSQAEGQRLAKGDPRLVARRYLIALLEGNTKKLRRLVAKGHNVSKLHPPDYEAPFEDQYYYLALEMPLVEMGRDEVIRREGGEYGSLPMLDNGARYLIGLYWDTELHFHLVPDGDTYRVIPGDHLAQVGL